MIYNAILFDMAVRKKKTLKKATSPAGVKRKGKAIPKPKNPVGRPTSYNKHLPQQLLDYFQNAVEEIDKVIQDKTRMGLKFVQKPVEPPLLSTFAALLGTHRQRLHTWASRHEDFGDAMKTAKEIQERVVVRMVSHGAYPPAFGIFMLKNCSDWTDRQELNIHGPLQIVIDEQDKDA